MVSTTMFITNEWVLNIYYIYTEKVYSAAKKYEILRKMGKTRKYI